MLRIYGYRKARPLWRIDTPDMRSVVRREEVLVLDANRHYWDANHDEIYASLDSLGLERDAWVAVIYRPDADPVILAECERDDLGDRVLSEFTNAAK